MTDTTSPTAEAPDTTGAPGIHGHRDRQPRLSMVGNNTMMIETPNLHVGVTTASGLRIWGTDSTEIAFGEPGPRPELLPKPAEDIPWVHSRYFAVYDRSHHNPAKVPQVLHIRELPSDATGNQATASVRDGKLSAYIRIDLYDPPENVAGPAHKAVAEAVIFIPTK